ncbi:MAG: ribbon-helix-helix domain-containing protein [Nanoarchaeota archaeon]|jgi:Arc/MetJ-type ribon-helix-helix transcriptional regulator|nr:ribbon-helix-helix domain-containing protein [Nanoarchaeota archaeon]
MENISLKLEKNFADSIKRAMKNHNYSTKTEFIRAALREKLAQLEEQEILNDPDMMAQLRESERAIKKGKLIKLKF